jgi:hypothetical protein
MTTKRLTMTLKICRTLEPRVMMLCVFIIVGFIFHQSLWNVTSGRVVSLDRTPREYLSTTDGNLPSTNHSDWFPDKMVPLWTCQMSPMNACRLHFLQFQLVEKATSSFLLHDDGISKDRSLLDPSVVDGMSVQSVPYDQVDQRIVLLLSNKPPIVTFWDPVILPTRLVLGSMAPWRKYIPRLWNTKRERQLSFGTIVVIK